MKRHLNTVYIISHGAYLSKDGEAVVISIKKEKKLQVPIHQLEGIVFLGGAGASPQAMQHCAEHGVCISFLSTHGRFKARVSGATSGNVLLRRAQYRVADTQEKCLSIARQVILGKVLNSRTVLMRGARDSSSDTARRIAPTVERLAQIVRHLMSSSLCHDLDQLRGMEGDAARDYFAALDALVLREDDAFAMKSRSRRPPLDRMNALLSFLYALLEHDARSACEASGLDPAVGFLHRDRPGRWGLALDLMEELRPVLCDRVALTLINRKQVQPDGFDITDSGAVRMTEKTRRVVVATYQSRKQSELTHPVLGEKTTLGLVPHIQSRLLSRHLRGETDTYPPYVWR